MQKSLFKYFLLAFTLFIAGYNHLYAEVNTEGVEATIPNLENNDYDYFHPFSFDSEKTLHIEAIEIEDEDEDEKKKKSATHKLQNNSFQIGGLSSQAFKNFTLYPQSYSAYTGYLNFTTSLNRCVSFQVFRL